MQTFVDPSLLQRLRVGPLALYLDAYLKQIEDQGFSPIIGRRGVRIALRCGAGKLEPGTRLTAGSPRQPPPGREAAEERRRGASCDA